MRKLRSVLPFAPEHGVRRTWSRPAELLRRDLAHPAVEPRLGEDHLGELGPRALPLRGQVPRAVRKLEQLARRLGEMAHEGRLADLVRNDRDLVLLLPEREHRSQEVLAGGAEEPRAAHDPAVAQLALAGELRAPVRGE